MKKWKVCHFHNEPEARIVCVDVIKESDDFIFIGKQKHAKKSRFTSYFDSKLEAFNFLENIAVENIKRAEHNLQYAKDKLQEIKDLGVIYGIV